MTVATTLEAELEQFKRDGVYKRLNYLASPQAARVQMEGRGEVVILSSNNYLGLCNTPEVVAGGGGDPPPPPAPTGRARRVLSWGAPPPPPPCTAPATTPPPPATP